MEFEYNGVRLVLEKKLVPKLNLIEKRITVGRMEQNAYITNHGLPGEGKSNSSFVEAAYLKMKTGREVHLFFRLSNLIEFAKKTENKIIIWDEPSLDAMNTDQMTTIFKDLMRLVNTARKRRHTIIINITKFWRFSRDLLSDTCLFMIHMNSDNGKDPGRFFYLNDKAIGLLRAEYDRTGKKCYSKFKSFGGVMPYIRKEDFYKLDFTIEGKPHATWDDYDRLKDESIESIGKKEEKKANPYREKLMQLRYRIGKLKMKEINTKDELAAALGISAVRLFEWSKMDKNEEFSLENDDFEGSTSSFTSISMGEPSVEVPTAPKEAESKPIINENKPKRPLLALFGRQINKLQPANN